MRKAAYYFFSLRSLLNNYLSSPLHDFLGISKTIDETVFYIQKIIINNNNIVYFISFYLKRN